MVSFLLLEVFKQSIDTSSSGHTQHGADSHVRLSGNTRVRSTSQAFASCLFNSTLAHTVYPMITHSYVKCLGTHFTYLGTRLLLPAAASEHPPVQLFRGQQILRQERQTRPHRSDECRRSPTMRQQRGAETEDARDHKFLLKGQLIAAKGPCQSSATRPFYVSG